jgi:hypothetical protein
MRDFPYTRTNMGHSFMCVYGVISYGRFKMWDVITLGLDGLCDATNWTLKFPPTKAPNSDRQNYSFVYSMSQVYAVFYFTSLDIHTVRPIKPVTTTAPRNREINRKLTSRDEPLAVIEAPRANFFLDSFLVKKHRRFMRV